jgi:hypothetical protein
MPGFRQMNEVDIAAIRRRRAGVRASLACEGLHLTSEEEALFERFDREKLTPDQRRDQLLAYSRTRRSNKVHAAE